MEARTMAGRIACAEWTGELANGRGRVNVGGEALGLAYTPAWLQEGAGTNPEELLAAAHAASFAIALQAALSSADHRVHVIQTRAELHLDHREDTWTITRSHLEGQVCLDDNPSTRDLCQAEFRRVVNEAASHCPISRALAGVEVTFAAEPVSYFREADPTPAQPRPVDRSRERDRRERRVFQGEIMSQIRARARHRRVPGATRKALDGGPKTRDVSRVS
jgi:lipoyl-dependent peroxiredoxin